MAQPPINSWPRFRNSSRTGPFKHHARAFKKTGSGPRSHARVDADFWNAAAETRALRENAASGSGIGDPDTRRFDGSDLSGIFRAEICREGEYRILRR